MALKNIVSLLDDGFINEKFWKKIKFLIPQKSSNKKVGRPRFDDRIIMSGIIYLLEGGIQWRNLPPYYGSKSTVHRRFQEWVKSGSFFLMWDFILMELFTTKGLDLETQSLDCALTKAPIGGTATGRNPTDRGKIGTKRSMLTDGGGIPLGLAIGGANRHDTKLFKKTLFSMPQKIPTEDFQKMCLDLGYDSEKIRETALEYSYIPYGRSKHASENVSNEQYRWVVERSHGWLNRFRRILIRWEKKVENYIGMIHLAFAIIIYKKLVILG